MNTLLLCIGVIAITASVVAQSSLPITAVPNLDLQRYLGRWYEIARLPNSFQTKCSCDVVAQYTLLAEGDIEVTNRCRKANGEMSEAVGKAKRASDSEPVSKLKVRFAPAILSWLPFVWGDYWVIILASDYSYAVVGEPSRKYLWVLSRSSTMPDGLYGELMGKLANMGYDTRQIQKTIQTGK